MAEAEIFYFIETLEDLEGLSSLLEAAPRVGVDLESDSFYSYHPKVCLLQLSTDEWDAVVDPLAVRDMSPLGPLFRNPEVLKVFHSAEYDIQSLKRDYAFEVTGIFDTAVAARLMGIRELGLAALIRRYFGVHLSKKLQRADWGKRPLGQEHLDYARMDTHYLLALRDLLFRELEGKDLLEDAREEFRRLERIEAAEQSFNPDGFWRLSGARSLAPRDRAVLKELHLFRERKAAALDRASFRVLPEALLVRLAEKAPEDMGVLERMLTPYLFRAYGPELLESVRRGLAQPPIGAPPERPRTERWDNPTTLRYQELREWRKKKAQERGMDPVLVVSTQDLRTLARAPSEGGEASSWLGALSDHKRRLYGAELLGILQTPPPAAKRRRRR